MRRITSKTKARLGQISGISRKFDPTRAAAYRNLALICTNVCRKISDFRPIWCYDMSNNCRFDLLCLIDFLVLWLFWGCFVASAVPFVSRCDQLVFAPVTGARDLFVLSNDCRFDVLFVSVPNWMLASPNSVVSAFRPIGLNLVRRFFAITSGENPDPTGTRPYSGRAPLWGFSWSSWVLRTHMIRIIRDPRGSLNYSHILRSPRCCRTILMG